MEIGHVVSATKGCLSDNAYLQSLLPFIVLLFKVSKMLFIFNKKRAVALGVAQVTRPVDIANLIASENDLLNTRVANLTRIFFKASLWLSSV